MNWSSFSTGAFFAACMCVGVWLTAPAVEPEWRKCAASQDGEELVYSAQHPDRTECYYVKKPTGRVIQRKKVLS